MTRVTRESALSRCALTNPWHVQLVTQHWSRYVWAACCYSLHVNISICFGAFPVAGLAIGPHNMNLGYYLFNNN